MRARCIAAAADYDADAVPFSKAIAHAVGTVDAGNVMIGEGLWCCCCCCCAVQSMQTVVKWCPRDAVSASVMTALLHMNTDVHKCPVQSGRLKGGLDSWSQALGWVLLLSACCCCCMGDGALQLSSALVALELLPTGMTCRCYCRCRLCCCRRRCHGAEHLSAAAAAKTVYVLCCQSCCCCCRCHGAEHLPASAANTAYVLLLLLPPLLLLLLLPQTPWSSASSSCCCQHCQNLYLLLLLPQMPWC
jgi:hypothetical protein